MFVNRTAPYGTVVTQLESLGGRADLGGVRPGRLAARSVDDGVWQSKQRPADQVHRDQELLAHLPRRSSGYDVEKLYAERASRSSARGLAEDDLIVDVTVLPVGGDGQVFMDEQDVVLSFLKTGERVPQ